jgi:GST-like protein
MITLYTHSGPNPLKVAILLEELAVPHHREEVDVWHGAGQAPGFLALNPNGKIPVIHDDDTGQVVFESNAILMYLADQAGRLLPAAGAERWRAIQLLFFQAASIGPMFGQRVWFDRYTPEPVPYAIERYHRECERLCGVVEALLAGRDWFLDDYSIVDIAHFGWLSSNVRLGYSLDAWPQLARWFDRVAARPAVQRALAGA